MQVLEGSCKQLKINDIKNCFTWKTQTHTAGTLVLVTDKMNPHILI